MTLGFAGDRPPPYDGTVLFRLPSPGQAFPHFVAVRVYACGAFGAPLFDMHQLSLSGSLIFMFPLLDSESSITADGWGGSLNATTSKGSGENRQLR